MTEVISEEKKNPYGYDAVDEVPVSGGRYLSFGKGDKGRVIQMRLASEPVYILNHWVLGSDGRSTPIVCKGEDCPYCKEDIPPKERLKKVSLWGWVVIDREDNGVKLFSGPFTIASQIKEISELVDKKTGKPVWGNPTLYDIQIERTEEPGKNYYRVTPMPEGKGKEITKEEKEAVESADIKLKEELIGSKKSDNTGNYSGDAEVEPKRGQEPAEEVDPSDIPF